MADNICYIIGDPFLVMLLGKNLRSIATLHKYLGSHSCRGFCHVNTASTVAEYSSTRMNESFIPAVKKLKSIIPLILNNVTEVRIDGGVKNHKSRYCCNTCSI